MPDQSALPADLRRPFVYTLPLSQRTLRFKELAELGDRGITEAFQLIADAAERGDNFGLDEVPTESYFRWLLSHIEAEDSVAVYNDVTSSNDSACMSGLLIVAPCRYARSPNPPVCTLIVVTAESLAQIPIWQDLVRIGFEIGRRPTGSTTDFRYTGCMIDVFVTCYDRVLALRNEGYVVTACIPNAGIVAKFPEHHVASYVMYKEFGVPQAPVLTTPSDVTSNSETGEENEVPADIELHKVPYLPVTWTLTDGTQIRVRNLEGRDEIRSYYATVKMAAETGLGFGADELPNLAYFVEWYVSGFYNIVYELLPVPEEQTLPRSDDAGNRQNSTDDSAAATDKNSEHSNSKNVIAYCNFGPSWFSRSVDKPLLGDGNVIILPRFRGRRWAAEIQSINMGIGYDVNMKYIMGEMAMSNLPIVLSTRNLGTITGSIPRAIYFRKTGWTDLVTLSWVVPDEVSFLEKLKQRQQQQQSLSKL